MALENGLSIADAMALAKDGDNTSCGFGGGWFIWIFFFFFLMMNGGFWGNNNAATKEDLCQGFNFNNLERQVESNNNYLRDGFYSNNTNMLTGFNNLGMQLADNRFAQQSCCCETNRNIDSVRAENYRNTCEITTAIHGEAEQTRALMTQQTIQDLRDRLEARDRDLLQANIMASQIAQTQQIVNMVRPFPIPAYVTCSPYTSANNVTSCGVTSGCGNCVGY